MQFRKYILILILLLAGSGLRGYSRSAPSVEYIPYDDARPILEAMAEALPADLRSVPEAERPVRWPAWVRHKDADTRARLMDGDEDSLVNFMLFGTSFTRRPRITLAELTAVKTDPVSQPPPAASAKDRALLELIQGRADDLVDAASVPDKNERLLF